MSEQGINVQKVAKLARLQLTEDEATRYADQLGNVLKYVDMLGQVDTSNVEPLAHPHEVTNVLRDDERKESLPRDAALSNAPKTDGKYFLVPPILDTDA
ncbi:MAG: Asp-tRNA(Asn)/Glu-tRNA(Gln) amidotransferase subunit GatC [Planctomycetaceae bacterium]|nr:Asp-tRNA(Asn)/Glu-tRNA(Gln) amidotransferase subunit GatC [Planctomycetaceae bacterium]